MFRSSDLKEGAEVLPEIEPPFPRESPAPQNGTSTGRANANVDIIGNVSYFGEDADRRTTFHDHTAPTLRGE